MPLRRKEYHGKKLRREMKKIETIIKPDQAGRGERSLSTSEPLE